MISADVDQRPTGDGRWDAVSGMALTIPADQQGWPWWWLDRPDMYDALVTARRNAGVVVTEHLPDRPTPVMVRAAAMAQTAPHKVARFRPSGAFKGRSGAKGYADTHSTLERAQRAATGRLEAKSVRHVRTAAGEQRFGQPIGSIIVRDGSSPLKHLQSVKNDFEGWQKMKGSDGNHYYVGKQGNEWVGTDDKDSILVHASSEQDAYTALDDWVDKNGVTVRKMTRAERVASRPKNTTQREPKKKTPKNFKKTRSDYEGYDKYQGDDGHTYYLTHDEDNKDYVVYDEQDKEIGSYVTESDALDDLQQIVARRLVEQGIAGRRAKSKTPPANIASVAKSFEDSTFTDNNTGQEHKVTDLKDQSFATGMCADAEAAFAAAYKKPTKSLELQHEFLPHYATVVEDHGVQWVVDFAFRQFDPNSEWPVIEPLDDYKKRLGPYAGSITIE